MAVPSSKELYEPVRDVIAESGGAITSLKVRIEVAKRLNLTAEDWAQMPPKSPTGVYANHVAHALKNLQHYGLISGRGVGQEAKKYQITPLGRTSWRNGESLQHLKDVDELLATTAGDEEPAILADPDSVSIVDDLRLDDRDPGQEETVAVERERWPFDPDAPPPEPLSEFRTSASDEALQKAERAIQGHRELLARLYNSLVSLGWRDLEWDRSVDLWGVNPSGARVIFEAKTIADNELSQLRGALAQVLEYRCLYGSKNDLLAIAVSQSVSPVRADVPESVGVALLVTEGEDLKPANALGRSPLTPESP